MRRYFASLFAVNADGSGSALLPYYSTQFDWDGHGRVVINPSATVTVRNPDGTTNYDDQANQNLAKNLRGKLLIAFGTADNNVPPYNSLLLVDELIKANKDFDLILLPNRTHGFGNEAYMVRRRWDYFVKYLLGAEPPREYEIGRLRLNTR